jgi:glutamate-ammonia-ligase adenylyltransferase
VEGGLVDLEFAAQFLQLVAAEKGGLLVRHTGDALEACEGLADNASLNALRHAWVLQQDLSQVLRVAIPDATDPSAEPAGFLKLLARTGGARDFKALTAKLKSARTAARKAFLLVVR